MSPPPDNLDAKVKTAHHHHAGPWLALSLLANVLLLVGIVVALRPLGLPPPPPPPDDNGPQVKTNVVVRRENFTWDQIESTNYEIFVKNLRAVGCPEQTIRDIIVTELDRLYIHRRLSEVVYPNFQWWRAERDATVAEDAAGKIEALDAERRGILTALLGPAWDPQNNEQISASANITLTGPVLGDLPQDVKDTVYGIVAAAQEKIAAFMEEQRGKGLPVDQMELVRLREEPLAKLSSVLNPAQYQEFALRYSPAAEQLRGQLRTISMTPDQFRDLYNAVSSINGQPVFYYNGIDPALAKQRIDLRAQSDAIIKSIMGEQAYASFRLSLDPLYQSSKSTAAQLGVPDTSITPIYEINRATQAELNRIRGDTNMTSDEKVEAISQAKVEQQQSLAAVLGPEAFARWLQTHSGLQ